MTTLELPPDWIVPDWPAPERVRAFVTTRGGGVSEGAWGAGANGGMNLGLGSGDPEGRIERNRVLLNAYLPAPPRWLALQHGSHVVEAESVRSTAVAAAASTPTTARVGCCATDAA